ncbi:hypothetical protein THARTR1_07483 [Trichoderma harzianum]|uniref:Uncharacterized protein n=1 Tax=Trichoderma harzianum TaxID=5544 RepID=A0A2K0U3B9_TRIHA|nr:hypothetical protein THARTR1_07483 [Trichoderma harzianum]
MDDGLINAQFPGGYSNQPDAVFMVQKKLERKEVMAEMQPLLVRLRGKWTDELAADIAATLTPQKLQVMQPLAKALLSGWIYQQEAKIRSVAEERRGGHDVRCMERDGDNSR